MVSLAALRPLHELKRKEGADPADLQVELTVAEKFRELALLESRVALVGWMLGLLMNKKRIQ